MTDNIIQEITIFCLPKELLKLASSYLDYKDVLACAATSRQLRDGTGITVLKKGIAERLNKPIPFRSGK
jgi:hypothetical protein